MELERVNPPSLPRPSGFSHAVVTTGGRLVFLAGQIAHGADGAIVGDTIVAQFEQALANVLEALRAAGGEPGHLASLTIYAVDLDDYRAQRLEHVGQGPLELRDDRVAHDRAVGPVGDLARQEDQPAAGGHHRVREPGGRG